MIPEQIPSLLDTLFHLFSVLVLLAGDFSDVNNTMLLEYRGFCIQELFFFNVSQHKKKGGGGGDSKSIYIIKSSQH